MDSHPKVHLRLLEERDLTFLRDLANDPGVRENVVGWDWPLSDAGQTAWFLRNSSDSSTKRFIIESDSGSSIGLTGFWNIDWRNRTAEVAIKLGGNSKVRGHGYGVSAIKAIMDFGFNDAEFNRLYASILATNQRSIATFVAKCGWVEEGRLRQHIWRKGEYVDLVQIGIMRAEFVETGGNSAGDVKTTDGAR